MTIFDEPNWEALDVLHVDRTLCHTAEQWVRHRRQLRRGKGYGDDPFAPTRWATSKFAYDVIAALPEADPVRAPMLDWIARLLEQRVNLAVRVEWERARRGEPAPVDAKPRPPTLRALVRRALTEPGRRRHWLERAVAKAGEARRLTSLFWQRRAEAMRRLGVDVETWGAPAHDVEALARRWLERTRELVQELEVASLEAWVDAALGAGAAEAWPARISPASIQALLGERGLASGVEIDPGPLPDALGAASFVRCFARLGAAVRDALAPRDQPFVVAHDACGFSRLRLGAVFARAPWLGAFQRRELRVPAWALADRERAIAAIFLLTSRRLAWGVVLRRAALAGSSAHAEALREAGEVEFGLELSPDALGVMLAPRLDAEQRFAAWLLADSRAKELRDVHDEDWYRNPHAIDELYEQAALPAEAGIDDAAVQSAADDAFTALHGRFR